MTRVFKIQVFFVILVLVCGLIIHAGGLIGFDFSRIPGDLIDARFNNYILEHGYMYLTGKVHTFWSAPFMFPIENVIAMSDNLMGTLPLYSMFRLTGLDRETAYQCWIITMMIFNFAGALYVFNKLSNNVFASAIGAYIFAFSIVLVGQYNHVQVLPRFIIPFAFYFIIVFFRTYNLKYFLFALLSLVYQFYCGIYLGFLLFLGMLIMLIVYSVIQYKSTFLQLKKIRFALQFIGIIILSILLLYPMMKPYYDMSKIIGMRPFTESMPHIKSYFYANGGSPLWKFLGNIGDDLPACFNIRLFVGAIPWLSLTALIVFWKRILKDIKIVIITLFLLIIFTLKVGDVTLYKIIWLIPGFKSLNDIARIINIQLFFFGFFVTYAISMLINYLKGKTWIIALVFVFMLADQFINSKEMVTFSKAENQQRISNIVNKLVKYDLSKYDAFAFCPDNADGIGIFNIDAMLASQLVNKPTINGYSSTCISAICDFLISMDISSLKKWIAEENLNKEKILICFESDTVNKIPAKTIQLKVNSTGKFVCSDGFQDQTLVGDRENAAEWETFKLIERPDDKVNIKAYNGKFICVDKTKGNILIADRNIAGEWETFKIEKQKGGTIALKASNNKYISCNRKIKQTLIANKDSIGDTELFTIIYK